MVQEMAVKHCMNLSHMLSYLWNMFYVQVNAFDCETVALGWCIGCSHIFSDEVVTQSTELTYGVNWRIKGDMTMNTK